jgi:hypothetical protein
MPSLSVCDSEDVMLAWVKIVMPTVKSFLQAEGNPLPRIQVSRVGGAPTDIADEATISFTVNAATRPQCKDITLALLDALLAIPYAGSVVTTKGVLEAAHIISNLWFPDPVSDTPRYIVDVDVVTRPL